MEEKIFSGARVSKSAGDAILSQIMFFWNDSDAKLVSKPKKSPAENFQLCLLRISCQSTL